MLMLTAYPHWSGPSPLLRFPADCEVDGDPIGLERACGDEEGQATPGLKLPKSDKEEKLPQRVNSYAQID